MKTLQTALLNTTVAELMQLSDDLSLIALGVACGGNPRRYLKTRCQQTRGGLKRIYKALLKMDDLTRVADALLEHTEAIKQARTPCLSPAPAHPTQSHL